MSTRGALRAARPKVHALETDHGPVYIRALSGAGRAQYLALVQAGGESGVPMEKTAALGLCEPDGTLAYDIESPSDLAELREIDGGLLERICLRLFESSGLTKQAAEDAEKKSLASPS